MRRLASLLLPLCLIAAAACAESATAPIAPDTAPRFDEVCPNGGAAGSSGRCP